VATAPGKAASVLLWRHERLPLPLRYLDDERLVAALAQELNRAEAAGHLLEPGSEAVKLPSGKTARRPRPAQILGETLARGSERPPTREVVGQILAGLQLTRGYWARLETPFRALLVGLPGDRSVDHDGLEHFGRSLAGPIWHGAIRAAGIAAFREGTRGLERSASSRGWKAISQAEIALLSRLGQILPRPPKENAA
jgi:CRISPR system Cascade subunit CasA